MSFGQVVDMGKRDIYRMKIQISEDITYKWITITPYGGWDTWSLRGKDIISGNPFTDTYSAGIKFTLFSNWYMNISHHCTHQVIAGTSYQQYHVNRWDDTLTVISVGYHKMFSSIDIK
jgi:hypothetical protein